MYTTHLAENRRTYKIYHSRHLQSRLSLFPLLPKKGVVKFSADCRIISGITIMAFVHIQISLKGAKIGKKKKKKRRRWGRAAAAHGTISLCICCDMAWCERHLVLIRRIILRTDDEKKKKNKRKKFFACKTESERGNMKWIRNARNSRVNLTANFSWKFSG